MRLSGLECFAAARLGLGGPSLPQAEECGRRLIALAPYRETGHRILMEALEQRGNTAEALLVFDQLRVLLHDDLGIAPSPARAERPPTPAGPDEHDASLDLLRLREDVLARNLADQVRVVGAEVVLRLLPELVIVVALDDVSAHAIDLLHGCIVRGEQHLAQPRWACRSDEDTGARRMRSRRGRPIPVSASLPHEQTELESSPRRTKGRATASRGMKLLGEGAGVIRSSA